MSVSTTTPKGLATRGRVLWRETVAHLGGSLDPAQRELLLEACRLADRLDRIDHELKTGEGFLRVVADADYDGDQPEYVLRVDGALGAASRDANVLKQLLTALRLPDEATGARPQQRGARGAYKPGASAPAGRVSARDRLRAVSTGG